MIHGKDYIIIRDPKHPCLRCVWCRIEDGALFRPFPSCAAERMKATKQTEEATESDTA